MMAEVGERIAATTDTAALHPELDELKEKYVAAFVELGRQRERLAEGDREECDSASRTRMMQVPAETLDAIEVARAAAKEADRGVYECLGELQRLAQYATFDRLRALRPDEAARLGIK